MTTYQFKYSFALLLAAQLLLAGTSGKITGRVIDQESMSPLIGCNIVVLGITMGAATNTNGDYLILNVPPGNYTLRAMMIGYASVNMTDVEVVADLTTKADFTLGMEVIGGEEVTVVAKRELIKKDLTATTAIVNSKMLEILPITEVSEALELQAGFVNGHLRGGRGGEVAYWIDGVPVTDVFDGESVVNVNKNTVEEMQLISGAFNAEYGQAMSGIVNIITKDGSDRLSANISLYGGDYLSSHDNIFLNIDQFNPMTTRNIDGSLQGSIIPKKLYYYLNARWIYFQGVYEGQRRFNPNNIAYTDSIGDFHLSRPEVTNGDTTYPGQGNNQFVPMEWNQKTYAQAKLIWRLSPTLKFRFNIIGDNVTSQNYERMYKYNPDGNLTRHNNGLTYLAQIHQSLSNKTYYTLGFTRFQKQYFHRTYSQENDWKYIHSMLLNTQPYSFYTGGTNNSVFERETITSTFKGDFNSQITPKHLLKGGIEYRSHTLSYFNTEMRPPDEKASIDLADDDPFLIDPVEPPDSSIYTSSYIFEPMEFSTYIQDKMEFDELIVNIGIRFDYFDPKGQVLDDPSDPSIFNPIRPENRYEDTNNNGIQDEGEASVTYEDRLSHWFNDTSPKWKISPRLGASFPFTDRGVFHFSYGHFFQTPRFNLLYMNPDFDLGQGTGNIGVIGNADLRPEKTVSGELGVKLQLAPSLALDATTYFRDIRDLTGTRAEEITIFGGSSTYSKLVNSDFAYIRGVVLSLIMVEAQGWSGTVDYTYQIAKGTASDPEQARNAAAANQLPEIHLARLNWDQTHTFNTSVSFNALHWGSSVIAQVGSGLPYTPESVQDISTLVLNSSKRPLTWNVDVRAYYSIQLMRNRITMFIRIENLFDHLNHLNVYDDSGVADETKDIAIAISQNTHEYVNTIKEWYRNETFYSLPRRIEFGVDYAF